MQPFLNGIEEDMRGNPGDKAFLDESHHGLADLWMLQQHGFDLPGFNAESANFQLSVCAAEEFKQSI